MDFAQYDTVSSQEFKEAVMALLELAGKPSLADFFPILKPFDPQGFLRQGNVYGHKLLAIIDKIIDKRLESRLSSSTNNDVLDSLLNLVQKDESSFSRDDMRHLFFVSSMVLWFYHIIRLINIDLDQIVWFSLGSENKKS